MEKFSFIVKKKFSSMEESEIERIAERIPEWTEYSSACSGLYSLIPLVPSRVGYYSDPTMPWYSVSSFLGCGQDFYNLF